MLASFGLAFCVCGSPGPDSGPKYVDPATYVSPSGACELFVDPSRHFGAGPARYRASIGGSVVWEEARPWTLFDAEVDDDGWVIGCAYTLGDTSVPQGGRFGEVHLVVLASDGSLVVDVVEPRAALRYVDSGAEPRVERFVLARGLDRAVFLLVGHADRDVGLRWCSARVSDGTRLPDVDVQSALGTDVRVLHPLALRHVPGTDELLAQFHTSRPHGGSLTALLDVDGNRLRSRFDAAEFSTAHGPVALPWLDRRLGSSTFSERGRFSLVSFARRERETFAVAAVPTDRAEPLVESVACEDFDTDAFVARAAHRPNVAELPVAPFGLELVGVQALDLAGRFRPELVGSDGSDRLLFAERRGIEVLELGFDGRFTRAWRAAADTRRLEWANVEFASLRADGGLLVQTDWDERQPAWSFAADGRFEGERATCGVECPRADGATWVSGYFDVRLEAADGTELVWHARSASGRWLGAQFFGARSLGPDGSLAVQGRELAIFGADGTPRAAGACLGFPSATIANRGERIFAYRDGRVLVFEVATGGTFQVDLRRDVPSGASLAPVWNEARGELWLVDAPGGYALRYRPNG